MQRLEETEKGLKFQPGVRRLPTIRRVPRRSTPSCSPASRRRSRWRTPADKLMIGADAGLRTDVRRRLRAARRVLAGRSGEPTRLPARVASTPACSAAATPSVVRAAPPARTAPASTGPGRRSANERSVLTLRPFVARVTNRFVWRSPRRAARILFSFAHAEAASRVDLIVAAQLTASPVRRALYVRHALDEARHAKLFSLRSAELLGKLGRRRSASCAPTPRSCSSGWVRSVPRLRAPGRAAGPTAVRQLPRSLRTPRRRADAGAVRRGAGRRAAARGVHGDAAARAWRAASARRARALRAAAAWEAWRTWRRAGRGAGGRGLRRGDGRAVRRPRAAAAGAAAAPARAPPLARRRRTGAGGGS